ncbi:MAG: DegV family protein [Lachnospiraceae bacterium]|nr:DegV family protein [Lachnospiraceae bacterium]
MNSFVIISDSSCDIPSQLIDKYSINIVPFYVSLDHEKYLKEIEELSVEDLTSTLVNHQIYPKTSNPPISDYIDKFKPHLEAGNDILCFTLTEKFSGSYQSAVNAAALLLEEYPSRKIRVINSFLATGAQGLLVLQAAYMRYNGLTLDETADKAEKLKETGRVYFTVDSLDYLQKGGRIGKVGAFAGQILNIKPIIALKDGELIPQNKVRGNKKAIKEIVDLTLGDVKENPQDYDYCFVTSNRFEEIELVQSSLMDDYSIDIPFVSIIGATIGAHVGPTVFGICLIKKHSKL